MQKLLSMLVLVSLSTTAVAGTPLSADQIKKLVTGNTVDLYSHARNQDFSIYYAADGSATSRNASSGKIVTGSWRITDSGEWCNKLGKAEERCGQVIDNGDGTYNRMEDGNLRSVWKKINPGNTTEK